MVPAGATEAASRDGRLSALPGALVPRPHKTQRLLSSTTVEFLCQAIGRGVRRLGEAPRSGGARESGRAKAGAASCERGRGRRQSRAKRGHGRQIGAPAASLKPSASRARTVAAGVDEDGVGDGGAAVADDVAHRGAVLVDRHHLDHCGRGTPPRMPPSIHPCRGRQISAGMTGSSSTLSAGASRRANSAHAVDVGLRATLVGDEEQGRRAEEVVGEAHALAGERRAAHRRERAPDGRRRRAPAPDVVEPSAVARHHVREPARSLVACVIHRRHKGVLPVRRSSH